MAINYKLTRAEARLAEIIWARGEIASPELVRIAAEALGWKRTTTYTILKKLCDKGVARNDAGMVSALTREEFFAGQSRRFVEDTFGGSLPLFLASFIGGGKLTPEQAAELKRLIERHEE